MLGIAGAIILQMNYFNNYNMAIFIRFKVHILFPLFVNLKILFEAVFSLKFTLKTTKRHIKFLL